MYVGMGEDGDLSDYPCWWNLGDVELMFCSKIK